MERSLKEEEQCLSFRVGVLPLAAFCILLIKWIKAHSLCRLVCMGLRGS